ncbi:MAG: 16S rRNA (adenine(1518)-N(6)/adenine(1519)-N(6))-dimethyltransferase RsmA [Anaerolineae bacterium]|nr:16S rRNA (adenine(1518)-N(6)/adenine(1519)-N(6))-dimethyltransferase RsmA [Anaerolineae bacterium]
MNDRELLEQYAIMPKKSLGQNFLHDPNALQKIVDVAALDPETTVVEIGPGTGNLTRVLARHAARVIAVELDDRLIPLLQREFDSMPHIDLVHADILETNLGQLVGQQPYTVVANLPYYITSAVLRHLLESTPRPLRLVLTVQREVAERLTAPPGHLSLLAVSVQFYGQPAIVTRLSPAAFWPRPDIESAVIRIDVYDTPPVDVPNTGLFFKVVRAGFSQKRKQLRNALSGGLGINKQEVEVLLENAGILAQRRAETLTLDEWAALAWTVAGSSSSAG